VLDYPPLALNIKLEWKRLTQSATAKKGSSRSFLLELSPIRGSSRVGSSLAYDVTSSGQYEYWHIIAHSAA
jgi:hypothetical protein